MIFNMQFHTDSANSKNKSNFWLILKMEIYQFNPAYTIYLTYKFQI